MAKFDAATAVDPMEFDLSKYGGPTGTIPEPTNGQIEAFFSAMQSASAKIGIKPGQQLTAEAMAEIPEDLAQTLMAGMLDALVGVGGGSFTAEHVQALPFRVQAAFMTWVAGELGAGAKAPGTRS